MRQERSDVVIIGAGPAGAVAAGLLRRAGRAVTILEKETFPRFIIGESLLPQCMEYIEAAGMLRDVVEAGFQFKNGAAFACGDNRAHFDFRKKFSEGWGTTYQVQRGPFDKVLADAASRMGADLRYCHEVTAVEFEGEKPVVTVRSADGETYQLEGRFLLDASGYGRVLPRLLDWELPSMLPVRQAIFTHIEDRIAQNPAGAFDRDKILISVPPDETDVWFWLIPFSNGRSSLGVVGRREQFDSRDNKEQLLERVARTPNLAKLLKNAVWDTPVRSIVGYSANVKALYGRNFALLGNTTEFLDPVFSSGVTIAFKSSDLAVKALLKQLDGEKVDWDEEYAKPLMVGVETFRAFVTSWYDRRLQDIIFHPGKSEEIEQMISSILAGYAWDEKNPFVAKPSRRLASVQAACEMV
ncbi:MAG: NAD(P)/FAD-dependent oxidoreductase [Proteobacteria bacterium]|nr:NAD(P)/FAD-dependent oxidoreductase [Cystobacterineae bacterium]MCL2258360.1 NAD(P)/FAD-dependent oxidoreductase [Cystobacterineae bacterium]MCL2315277.1 NAD(P)/FAD-dependent oxidoreductase [Pseudomonadota bacterium]